jgi:hypothetical protein
VGTSKITASPLPAFASQTFDGRSGSAPRRHGVMSHGIDAELCAAREMSVVGDVLAETVGEFPPRQRKPVAVDEGIDSCTSTTDRDGRSWGIGYAGQTWHGDKQGSQSLC